MAYNFDRIFHEFILNKIKEIGVQNEEETAVDVKGAGSELAGDMETTSERKNQGYFKSSISMKKHKKHKRKKKKKRNHDKESNDIITEPKKGTKHQQRRGKPKDVNAEQGEDESKSRFRKWHVTGKRKQKRRRRVEEDASESDTEDAKCGQRLLPRCVEELPDIIPKQDSSNKGRGHEECRQSHFDSHSHYFSERRKSCSKCCAHHHTSRSHAIAKLHALKFRSSFSETKGGLDESTQMTQAKSKDWHVSELVSRPTSKAEKQTNAELLSEELSVTNDERTTKLESVLNQPVSATTEKMMEPSLPQCSASEYISSLATIVKSQATRKRKQSNSPQKRKESESSSRYKQSKSSCRSHRRSPRSSSRPKKRRSRSRSAEGRSRRSRSHSQSCNQRRATYSQRDRWKREPRHSPILILRKNRSRDWKHRSLSKSPQRISELDKEQLLEIAKANAAAMCAKAGMPIPSSLRSSVLPLALPSMAMNAAVATMTAATVTAALSNIGTVSALLPLNSITNKPPPGLGQPTISALDEVKRKVIKQANSISIKEFTEKCKMIVDSKGELPMALPHVPDEEDNRKPFGESAIQEQKGISFSINTITVRPTVRRDVGIAKEFPVSSGSQHRKKEGETLDAYGEWAPVEKADTDIATARKFQAAIPIVITSLSSDETVTTAGVTEKVEKPIFVPDNGSIFPDQLLQQPVDISHAVIERIKAQRILAENPYDVSAICRVNRAQEQVDAWAQSNIFPGLFTGTTGAQVLSSEEISTSGPQAWLKKDQFLRAAPVSGGVGELLMRKMGWKTGEGLGRNREGTVEPIIIDFKVDRKGLVADGEKVQKQTGGLVVTKDLMGKHPVSALIELCNKRRILQPEFVMVHHSGPDHRKNFLFKVTVNGIDYQPQTPSPNKKHAKAMAATVALQALGEVPVDGPGLYTGPVFTAASTGPLFST